MTPTYCGLVWNMIYATLNALLGMFYGSRWFISIAFYHILLGMMRLAVVSHDKSKQRDDPSILVNIGWALILAAFVLGGIVTWTIEEHRNQAFDLGFMFLIAAGTILFVVWTVHNTLKARTDKSLLMISLRNISFVSAVGALLSLERSLFGTFGMADLEDVAGLEMVSGAAGFLVIAFVAGKMIQAGKKQSEIYEKRNGPGKKAAPSGSRARRAKASSSEKKKNLAAAKTDKRSGDGISAAEKKDVEKK